MLITLSEIVANSKIQPRVGLDQSHIDYFAQLLCNGETLEPVIIFNDGQINWLSDGFHRFAAHRQAGVSLIHADVQPGSQRDAFLFAVEKNARHGLPLSLAERKQAALRLLLDDEWSKWSANQIGKLCGLYHKTIEKLRAALDVNAQSLYASPGGSGTSSQMLQSVSWEIPKIRNLTDPSLPQNPSQMLQSVSWEIPKIRNLTDPSLSQDPSQILQSVSGEIPQIQNLTDDPKTSPITRKAALANNGMNQGQTGTSPNLR